MIAHNLHFALLVWLFAGDHHISPLQYTTFRLTVTSTPPIEPGFSLSANPAAIPDGLKI